LIIWGVGGVRRRKVADYPPPKRKTYAIYILETVLQRIQKRSKRRCPALEGVLYLIAKNFNFQIAGEF